MHTRIEVMYIV